MSVLASREPNPSHFPPCRAAGVGPSLVCSHSPSFFSLPDLTCRDQEIIKIDGEQIALARSSLLKRVVAGKQLSDVKKLSGYQSDWEGVPSCHCLLPWPRWVGNREVKAPQRCLGLGPWEKANGIPICFLPFFQFSRKMRQRGHSSRESGQPWAAQTMVQAAQGGEDVLLSY